MKEYSSSMEQKVRVLVYNKLVCLLDKRRLSILLKNKKRV